MQRIAIRRPAEHLSAADIVRLHAKGEPVPMVEFTVVVLEGGEYKRPFPEDYTPRS